MAEKSSSTAADKKKKKLWVSILAPKEFNSVEIGETYVEEPASCIGRFVESNLMVLTGDPKKQSNNANFRINEYKDNSLRTELMSFGLQVAQVKRLTRKQKDKIEDSFLCLTKDNIKVRIKPSFIAKSKVINSKKTLIRMFARNFIINLVKNMSYTQIMMDIVNNDLQKNVKNGIKKTMPITSCIIKAAVREN